MNPEFPNPPPSQVVYVQATPAPTNGLGVAGFVISLIGLLTCGCISPLGAIFSFVGCFGQPKGLAIAGLIIGCVGSLGFALFGFAFLAQLAAAASAKPH